MAVTATHTTFSSSGVSLVGNLYRPADAEGRLPGVVVTGTWTSVKEQMANRYAEALAARGFAALSFDFTGFGESGGDLRDTEDPARKVVDIHAAVTHLVGRDDVDPARIAALAVCASAGYTTVNAVADSRIKAIALIAPWLHDADIVEEMYGGTAGVAARIAAANAARVRFETTGEVEYVPAVGPDDPLAAMPMPIDFYEDPARGAIPQWPNRFATMAWTGWLTFDPIRYARHVSVPTLLVHSEDAAIPAGAHRFFDQLTAPKAEVWRDGTQFDFYDGPDHVARAADRAADHFRSALRSREADGSSLPRA